MHEQRLDGDGWTVRAVGDLSGVPEHIRGKTFPARVPGCVHLDLIRAGVLRHPNVGYAERDQEWIGRTDWRYEIAFTPDPALVASGRARIRCECLDTIATVELNGSEIGTAANYHVEHAFSAGRALKPGENVLVITFAAPIPFVEREHARLGRLPHNGDELGWHPFNMIRKPACNFGWDWGPRVATSGVQGHVWLEDHAHPSTWCQIQYSKSTRWSVSASIEGGFPAPPQLRLSLEGVPVELSEVRVSGGATGRITALVDRPRHWWPRGFGEQTLYDLELAAGQLSRRWRVGFFETLWYDLAHELAPRFALRYSDKDIWCRGANWIPDALFPGEVSPARIRERVRQAADANMNMLRVWGGGMFEQDAFYDACDELGILVWQDFMYACAVYPEDDASLRSAVTEAQHQVMRLNAHPSLVLWCGGNECVEGYQHWGWKQRMGGKGPSGKRLFEETLPESYRESVGWWTSYWPNSPWSEEVEDVRDPDYGDRHTWDLHFEDVRKIVPRFVSEFGRVAPACERTLWEAEVFGSAAPASWPREAPPLNDAVRAALEHRLRQTRGSTVAYEPVLPAHFRHPAKDLRAWLWQTQVLQARALTTHIEWLRANSPRCMGALIWQLNDCWACQSWSLIDSAARPKPAWYAVRRAFAPRLLTIQPTDTPTHTPLDLATPLSAVLVNDTDEPFDGECRIRRLTFAGLELARATVAIGASARSNARLDNLLDLVGPPDDPTTELLVAELLRPAPAAADLPAHRALWFFHRDRELHLPPDPLTVAFLPDHPRPTLRLTANALARDIIIAADLLGPTARAADNCLTRLPGETLDIKIEHADPALLTAIPIPELIRSASGPCLDEPRAQARRS